MQRFILLVAASLVAAPALAQEETEGEEERQQFTVTPPIYRKLTEAHELIGKNSLDKAMDVLNTLEKKRGLNDHEKALVLQAQSHVYAAREKYGEAARTLEACVALNALPAATLLQSRYNLGQLYLALGQFQKAIASFTEWLKMAKNPQPAALYTIAVAYTQAKQPNVAIGYAQRAVNGSNNPQDSWLQLLLSLQFELKQYGPASNTLKILLKRNPKKKTLWLQLASAYEELRDPNRALAVMELAYRAGALERPEEHVNLVQRFVAQGAPAKGAHLLEEMINAGRVPPTFDNLKLLANAWLYARNRKGALEAFGRMAKNDSTGSTHLRIAHVYVEMQRWDEATKSLRNAIAKGGIDNPGQAHLLLGTVLVNQKKFEAARQSFLDAKKFEGTAATAVKWLGYLEKQQ